MMKIERDWTFENLLFYGLLNKQILLEKEDERLDNELQLMRVMVTRNVGFWAVDATQLFSNVFDADKSLGSKN